MNNYKMHVKQTLEMLSAHRVRRTEAVEGVEFWPCGYKAPDSELPKSAPFTPLEEKPLPGEKDGHGWLRFLVHVSAPEEGLEPFLRITTASSGRDMLLPQCILYVDGEAVQGVDINHAEYPLTQGDHEVYLYYYSGMIACEGYRFTAAVLWLDRKVEKLYYDMLVPFEAVECFPDHYDTAQITLRYLEAASCMLDFWGDRTCFLKSVALADEYLEEEFYSKVCGRENTLADAVSCIGHTHIDVAWLWTYAQTKEKVQRSFATVLQLMREYPEYRFMSSQPQLYQYLKEEAPSLYEGVREAVKAGRWEPEGAMWVEADCNLISGESMVRQILYGKQFFKEEFGKDSHILWLPDVFGYSAAMPQIMKKAGIDTFVTSKISWNDTNKMPYDTFIWRGIDGSEVFSYFLTAQESKDNHPVNYTTYNGYLKPSQILGAWERYQQKDYNNAVAITYGFGDGGGGPTRDMLEQQRRMARGIPGIPVTKMENPTAFFSRARKNFEASAAVLPERPTWVGELYLELHRGTYTTAAKNKKNNRASEFLLGKAEALAVFEMIVHGTSYPKETLDRAWKTVLLNQFHDVLPGSSIKEVYEDSDGMYTAVLSKGKALCASLLGALSKDIASEGGLLLYNPNGMACDGIAFYQGKPCVVHNVPPFGWKVVKPKEEVSSVISEGYTAENQFFRLTMAQDGGIVSLMDKRAGREIFRKGEAGNRFYLYEDRPYAYDAWEFTRYGRYKRQRMVSSSVEPYHDEVCGGFVVHTPLPNGEIIQKILLYDDIDRIDFVTKVSWHEEHQMLKVVFPLDINADKASYDIQFGHVERARNDNTSWEEARFETVCHKWMDVSEGGFGVSLLNNCKYGVSADQKEVTLSLLKAPTNPNPDADRGEHTFTYALYPHEGPLASSGVIRQAYMLNNPIEYRAIESGEGHLPPKYSMLSCDKSHVILETVKAAEDGEGIIVRMYEACNIRDRVTVHFGFGVQKAVLCDLCENKIEDLEVTDSSVTLPIGGFEIVTLRLIR